MSFHDTRLHSNRPESLVKAQAFRRGFKAGVFSMGLFPKPYSAKIEGSAQDWQAVGDDLREAMRRVDIGK
jgi:hypothetical protein